MPIICAQGAGTQAVTRTKQAARERAYMPRRKPILLAAALAAFVVLSGCSGPPAVTGNGDFAATPPGPCPVLKVTARPARPPRCTLMICGAIDTSNAAERFAECLTVTARDIGALNVMLPGEFQRRLTAAGLEPTLDPAIADLPRLAGAGRFSAYLTAHVSFWRTSYLLTSVKSTIEYRLACRLVGSDKPLWEVHVRKELAGADDLEVGAAAARETLQWLKERMAHPESLHADGANR